MSLFHAKLPICMIKMSEEIKNDFVLVLPSYYIVAFQYAYESIFLSFLKNFDLIYENIQIKLVSPSDSSAYPA